MRKLRNRISALLSWVTVLTFLPEKWLSERMRARDPETHTGSRVLRRDTEVSFGSDSTAPSASLWLSDSHVDYRIDVAQADMPPGLSKLIAILKGRNSI